MVNTQILTPFAAQGEKNEIPQNGTNTDVLASYQLGFPPLTMQDAGGTPPNGKDVNGILYAICSMLQYVQAGGFYPYNATFAQAVGGYPIGARVLAADGKSLWINLAAGNTTDPDNGGTGWQLQDINPVGRQIGDIRMWHRPTIPDNALICDGSAILSDNYPDLYSAWFGSFQSGQTFYLPNLSDGYYPKGFGAGTQALGTRQTGALPNISGTYTASYFGRSNANPTPSGCFYHAGYSGYRGAGDHSNNAVIIGFNAAQSSGVYGNRGTATVETNSVALHFIVYFA